MHNVYSVFKKVSNGSLSSNKLLYHQLTLSRRFTGYHHLHHSGQISCRDLRLSLQTSCDYEANTNISRHFMAFTGGFRNGLSLFSFYDTCHLRNFIVVYSNLNFVPLENVCTLSSPGYSTTPLSPRRTERS